jgi:hypothetical protein
VRLILLMLLWNRFTSDAENEWMSCSPNIVVIELKVSYI